MKIHYKLLRLQAMCARQIAHQVSHLRLDPGQPKILECLWELEEASQREIANYCMIEPATCGSLLTRLEKKGLIERKRHENDRRTLFVSLTEEGKNTAKKAIDETELVDSCLLSGFSKEEIDQLRDYFKRMEENLSEIKQTD